MELINHIKGLFGHIVMSVSNNPKTAILVPTITASIAPLTDIAELQGYLSIISMCIGIVVSLILLRHRWLMLKLAEQEFKQASQKYGE